MRARTCTTLTWVLICLLSSFAWLQPADAQEKRRRPTSQPALTDQQVQALSVHWNEDRRPTLLVILGVESRGRIAYDLKDPLIDRIKQPIQRELRRAVGSSIVVPTVQELLDQAMMDQIRRAVGQDLAAAAQEQFKEQFEADIILDVTLLAGSKQGHYAVSCTAIDTRKGRQIAAMPLSEIPVDATPRVGSIFGTAVCKAFIKQYKDYGTTKDAVKRIKLRLSALLEAGSLDNKKLRRIRRGVKKLDGVEDVDAKWIEDGDNSFATLRVDYDGDVDDLLLDMDDEVLVDEKIDLAWRIVLFEKNTVMAFVFANEVPAWFAATDPKSDRSVAAAKERRTQKRTVGVLVGPDIAEPIAAFGADGNAGASFDHETLRGSLTNQLQDMGFSVVANAALREKLRTLAGNASQYENLPHLQRALAQIPGVDLVFHVNTRAEKDGSERLNAMLFDVKSARAIGFQRWPDTTSNRLHRYSVDSRKPEEVARYLVGRVISRWDREVAAGADDPESTLAVQVRNIEDITRLKDILALFRDEIAGVRDIEELQIATPVAAFDVVHRGAAKDLALSVINLLVGEQRQAEVQLLGDTLVVNLLPKPLDEEEASARAPEPVPLAKAPDEKPPKPPTGGGSSLVDALRAARGSVWQIFVLRDGKPYSSGTGWVVRTGLLATNVHVLREIDRSDASDGQFTAVAINDADAKKKLKLGRVWLHPGYRDDRNFDVAFVKVIEGDAGNPLTLATATQLASLTPPVRVGYVGFPGAVKSIDQVPVKQAMTGEMTALLDFQMVPSERSMNRVMVYNLVTAAGASGSPVFGPDGTVVAIHFAGNLTEASGGGSGVVQVKSGYNYGVVSDAIATFLKSIEDEL